MEYEIIAVDFDGTLVEDRYPEIGSLNEKLIQYLLYKKEHGAKLILWTCRTDDKLKEAVDACMDVGLIFDAVNENLPEAIEKYGGDCRKVFAHKYIDDKMCSTWSRPYYQGKALSKTAFDSHIHVSKPNIMFSKAKGGNISAMVTVVEDEEETK